MMTHAAPQFTPTQLIDAGRRAEAEGRPDLAVQFYRHVTENFAEAAQAAEAHGALGRIGPWQPNGGTAQQAAVHRGPRRQGPGRHHYPTGRSLTHVFVVLGWLVALAGIALLPAYLMLRIEDAAPSRAELLPMAGGAAATVILGLALVLGAHIARALFDQASAARDLLALERTRHGLE
jgi:hypothetical protein